MHLQSYNHNCQVADAFFSVILFLYPFISPFHYNTKSAEKTITPPKFVGVFVSRANAHRPYRVTGKHPYEKQPKHVCFINSQSGDALKSSIAVNVFHYLEIADLLGSFIKLAENLLKRKSALVHKHD